MKSVDTIDIIEDLAVCECALSTFGGENKNTVIERSNEL